MFSILNYTVNVSDIIDILIITFVLYKLLQLVQGTKAVHVAIGLGILVIIFFLADRLKLQTIRWLMNPNFLTIWILGTIIVFQNELRRALANLGANEFWQKLFRQSPGEDFLNIIEKAVIRLSKRRLGALIIIENNTGLNNYIETGVKLNANISVELLNTIFFKNTTLHDGAVIIRGNKIVAAGCILPLSDKTGLKKRYGTRHRAGLGLSEESDALIIIVSEETGNISVAYKGHMVVINEESLAEWLRNYSTHFKWDNM